jgi:predicted PurR-regulated permease PerM
MRTAYAGAEISSMNNARPSAPVAAPIRPLLGRPLQILLTIIAGTVVAVITWTIIARFLHILILLLASFIVAFLLLPLVNRLERGGVPRLASILLLYLLLFGALALGVLLLANPLGRQLQGVIASLPTYFNSHGQKSGIEQFLAQHGVDITHVRDQVIGAAKTASGAILGNTVAIVSGTITTVTDILLILVITFYFLLDGGAMRNRAVRLLPDRQRDRWFFVEATLNRVLGGYIRGQVVVAATVGLAAGVGCFFIGVYFPIVIGLLAFIFEFVPMLGPVLGMLPAVVISLFQPHTPVVLVIVYFIVLQQVESNLIVPRISGHAVGLHPLAALLALLAGLDLAGIGGALFAVPLAGVLYVLAMALYSDVTGHSEVLVGRTRRRPYDLLARQVAQRRGRGTTGTASLATAAPESPAANERLATIQEEGVQLRDRFEADQAEQAVAEAVTPGVAPHERQAPNDPKTPNVTL